MANEFYEIPPQQGYYVPPRDSKPKGFAITALVMGILTVVGYCCGIFVITAPLAIIFGIIALCKKQGGTAMSVTGIVLGTVSILIPLIVLFSIRDILPYKEEILADYVQVIDERDEIFAEYEKTRELPAFLNKYKEAPFSDLLAKYDADIYAVMDVLLEMYKSGDMERLFIAYPSSSAAAEAMILPATAW